jgi:hypothetical protein
VDFITASDHRATCRPVTLRPAPERKFS